MSIGNRLSIAALTIALGALVAPAFAQNGSRDMPSRPGRDMNMGHMGQGMMGGSLMTGCSEMMRSMGNGGNRTPNSQWHKRPPRTPDDGG